MKRWALGLHVASSSFPPRAARAPLPVLSNGIVRSLLLFFAHTQAEQVILSLVDESVSALFPVAMDVLHNWAAYWK
jgi:predicted ATPase